MEDKAHRPIETRTDRVILAVVWIFLIAASTTFANSFSATGAETSRPPYTSGYIR